MTINIGYSAVVKSLYSIICKKQRL